MRSHYPYAPHKSSLERQFGGWALITIALILLFIEVGLYVHAELADHRHSINWIMLLVSVTLGFVGMYVLNPRRAKDGGQFLVDNAIRIIRVIRVGRRRDDPIHISVEDAFGRTAEFPIVPPPVDTKISVETINESSPLPKRRRTDTDSNSAPGDTAL